MLLAVSALETASNQQWVHDYREEQRKLKEDAKCSSSLTVSKHARVPQMEIEYTVRMLRPGTA